MAITDELIETLGGGGTAGLAVAAVVLVPAVYPPARRGLRGLAKAAIVQYLRVTEPRALPPPAAEAPAAAAPTTQAGTASGAPARRRGRPPRTAAATAPTTEAAAGAAPAGARRRGRPPRAAAAAPAPAPVETAPARAPRPQQELPAPAAAAPPNAAPVAAPRPAPARPAATEAATSEEGAPARGRGRPRVNPEGVAADGRININTATRGQLTRLPRVGAQTADRIVEFRDREGPIKNLRQLRQADIISVAAARQMRDLVRF